MAISLSADQPDTWLIVKSTVRPHVILQLSPVLLTLTVRNEAGHDVPVGVCSVTETRIRVAVCAKVLRELAKERKPRSVRLKGAPRHD